MKLLSCPYCGSDNVQITLYNHPTVVCQSCWAMGPKGPRLGMGDIGFTCGVDGASREAHELWNKRDHGLMAQEWQNKVARLIGYLETALTLGDAPQTHRGGDWYIKRNQIASIVEGFKTHTEPNPAHDLPPDTD